MGDRYYLTVKCDKCGHKETDVWYAPTCGATEYQCPCGKLYDLAEYTGISYEDCSNREEIAGIVDEISKQNV